MKNTLTETIVKIIAKFETTKSSGKNCMVTESSLPVKNAMCIGAKVMLLTNKLV